MWIMDRLTYWKETAELTKQVIEAAGMDPNKVTPDELDDAKRRFVVFTGPGSSVMTIVGWRCLVSHPFIRHFSTFSRWLNENVCRSRAGTINLLENVHPSGGL
jgi:hypothetical protein